MTDETGDIMNLTSDERWMLDYLQTRIRRWNDVRDDASRTMKRIFTQEDFNDCKDCFLPTARQEELQRALALSKSKQVNSRQTEQNTVVQLNAKASRLLQRRAQAEQCSVSDLILRHLA